MHSIERYGIVALLFLVVTVIAVLMWDGGKAGKEKSVAAGSAPAARRTPGTTAADTVDPVDPVVSDGARRLSLSAPSQPGPLFRDPRPEPASAPPEPGANAAASAAQPLERADAPADSLELQSPHAQTVPDSPIAAAATHEYTVRAGDTLSEIAQRELGSARRWPELLAVNPGLDPARMRAGRKIQVPGAAPLASAARGAETARAQPASARKETAPVTGRTWRVGKGENLWKIAERALGDGKRWREIAALNPGIQADKLRLGQVLKLPATAETAPSRPKKSGAAPVVASAAAPERTARRGSRVR